ncbi:MAG: hypothetical protein GY737_18805 [Desulfobacteraceae bacterium]|nr:hypothetical protein [Desulfobacteraceae bacterium]
MGFEIIKDSIVREKWRKFIKATHFQLSKANIDHIEFLEFKYDGSYGKAKTVLPATKWVFAENDSDSWVELELKPRTTSGVKKSQIELYKFIKSSFKANKQTFDNITWDEDDRATGNRKPDCKDIRIKKYLNSSKKSNLNNGQWVLTMIEFIKAFDPIIQSYR